MKKFFKQGNKGFTLIELLVVIAILGTLAAVVVLNVTQFMGKGHEEADATERANIQTAVAAYMYENGGSAPQSGITAGDPSPLGAYLLTSPNCSYSIDATTGAVGTPGSCIK
jgi:type IV pilus assembly protein PilA